MDPIFMNPKNSKTADSHKLLLNFANLKGNKTNSKSDKYVALSNLSRYFVWKNAKKSYKNNKLKWRIWITCWIIFCIKYSRLFWVYLKKHVEKTFNSSITISIDKIENRIMVKIKTGYDPKVLTPETMKLLRSTKSKITANENGENIPNLEITELVLIYCNIVNNSYQQNSWIFHIFVSNKSFGQLLNISPQKCRFLKTFDSEFSDIEVCFTNQNSKSLEKKKKKNITLVIN